MNLEFANFPVRSRPRADTCVVLKPNHLEHRLRFCLRVPFVNPLQHLVFVDGPLDHPETCRGGHQESSVLQFERERAGLVHGLFELVLVSNLSLGFDERDDAVARVFEHKIYEHRVAAGAALED